MSYRWHCRPTPVAPQVRGPFGLTWPLHHHLRVKWVDNITLALCVSLSQGSSLLCPSMHLCLWHHRLYFTPLQHQSWEVTQGSKEPRAWEISHVCFFFGITPWNFKSVMTWWKSPNTDHTHSPCQERKVSSALLKVKWNALQSNAPPNAHQISKVNT